MELTCWGATRSVTGSMHYWVAAGRRVLLDCGLFQGSRTKAFERNSRLPFKASALDAIILSHAHLDHCGNLPSLIKANYDGPIFCTPATRDLTMAILRDSARIQETDAEYVNYRLKRRGLEPTSQSKSVLQFSRAKAQRNAKHAKFFPMWSLDLCALCECFASLREKKKG